MLGIEFGSSGRTNSALNHWESLQTLLISFFFSGAKEMAQRLRTYSGPIGDQNFVPSTYIRWFATACNSSSRGSNDPLWPLWALHSFLHITSQRCVYKHIIRIFKNLKWVFKLFFREYPVNVKTLLLATVSLSSPITCQSTVDFMTLVFLKNLEKLW